MANNDAPFGFKPWGEVLRARIYAVQTAPTINVFTNDMVHGGLLSLACTGGRGEVMIIEDANIIPATPGDNAQIIGSVLACFDENMVPTPYIAATEVGDGTVAGYVLVADHPMQQFVAQEDGDTAAIISADIGLNFDIYSPVLSLGNTYTGISKQEIDSDSHNTTVTIALRLFGMAYPNQDTVGSAGCRWICQVNPAAHIWGTSQAAL
jgi:hypothetical protein